MGKVNTRNKNWNALNPKPLTLKPFQNVKSQRLQKQDQNTHNDLRTMKTLSPQPKNP